MTDPTIPTVDANRALADQGEPNVPSKTAAPPPAPKAGQLVDKLGDAFDDALHERDAHGNPKMRADGGWCRKRGNGARKAAGKPLIGNVGKGFVSIAPKPTQPPPADGAPKASPAPSSQPTSAGAAGATIDAEPVPMLVEQDYEGTAIGLTNGGFSLMQLLCGPAWEPDANERSTWVGALRRLWFHYQLPRLGPIVEVLILIPATIAKRRDDARTKQGLAKVKAWLGIKPKPDDGKQPPAADAKAA